MKQYPLSLLYVLPICLLLSLCTLNKDDNNGEKPLIQTGLTQEVSEYSAIITASINPALIDGDYEMGVIVSLDSDCAKDNGILRTTNELGSNNSFSVKFTELNASTTYYYKAFVKFSGVYHYGDVKSFNTKDISVIINVTTGDCNINQMTLFAQIEIEDRVNLPFSSYGFYISDKYSTPTELLDNGLFINANNYDGIGFSARYYGFQYDTKYYYVAIVIVYGKCFMGEARSFTSPEDLGQARLSVSPSSVTIGVSGNDNTTVDLLATRDWHVLSKPDWVIMNSTEGVASAKNQTIYISCTANNEYGRIGSVVFTIGLMQATLEVIQHGAKGEYKKGSGTKEDPFSVTAVIEYVKKLDADKQTSGQFYVKGKVSTITQDFTYNVSNGNTYGNARFSISEDSSASNEFLCYGCYYLGNRKFKAGETDIKVGDDVIVCGKLVYYKGTTPEFVSGNNYLYSLNEKTQ